MGEALKYIIIGLLALSTMGTIYMVGRPREPIAHGTAVVSFIVNGLIIAAIAVYWQ
jgi:hypothetical protein